MKDVSIKEVFDRRAMHIDEWIPASSLRRASEEMIPESDFEKNKQAWQKWFEGKGREPDDVIFSSIVKLAYLWGKFMEEDVRKGRTVAETAWDSFIKADDIVGGTNGSMALNATQLLARYWEHGDALLAWHNEQAGIRGTAPYIVGKVTLESLNDVPKLQPVVRKPETKNSM